MLYVWLPYLARRRPMTQGKSLGESLIRRLFFTNKVVIGKDIFGNSIEIEGVFFNWLGRNLPYVVIGAWVVLMFAFLIIRIW
ncbi:hypothetical protein ADT28_00055 (plasmid) [Xylella fastidiosa]|nr:hypothetical protein ADT29_00055 [Xylella fastidiosa]KXB18614.1 hypothetical protein ADT28_00055 [Xylella fastidiosa]NRP55551.1 hypothetical protein [Xylella fastidiosa]NRP68589.1 hypothetical protein [Xylella fastidiosa]